MKLSHVAFVLLGGLVCFGIQLHALHFYGIKPTLSISTSTNIVKVGDEIRIDVELQNNMSRPFISMYGSYGFYTHEILVTRDEGDVVQPNWGSTLTGNITPSPHSVRPGGTHKDSFTLKERHFYLDKPDKYFIQVSIDEELPIWWKLFLIEPEHVVSNVLSVDVVDPVTARTAP